ncbi:MAG: GMC family oxidoreductase [Gemmatimonadetes bacterium]|nr:GMC family oxidoreductase [Gemmatimonadota bacterium]
MLGGGRHRVNDYDAIVIGSGITGGWAAKELTEAGLRTLVLEAGPDVIPERDYTEHVPVWDMKYRGQGDRRRLEARQAVQRECYACDELGSAFFVDDVDNPYTTPEDQPFLFLRGRQVGGRSIMWGRQVYRLSDLDFEANDRDGVGVDWPIRYRDLEPWYDYVEEFIGVSGQALGLAHLPDSRFLPPMEMTCAENFVREGMERAYGDSRVLTIGRCAVLTRDHRGRRACHYCGPCERGCRTRSYFSSLNATLPAAAATGRMTLRPDSVVHHLSHRDGRVSTVHVTDRVTREELEFSGRVVFLAASTLESTRILLNSQSAEFPEGLANSSGTLGRYLMDHTMGHGGLGDVPGFEDPVHGNRRLNGIYLPRFRNVSDPHPDFLRGFAYQGGGSRTGWSRGVAQPGLGASFKDDLIRPGPWRMILYGFGECLPHPDNRVELDPEVTDAWGIPALNIQCRWRENEVAMFDDMADSAAEMLEATGVRNVETFHEDNPPGKTIHEMGTARMGRDPATSVLNSFNQAHDIENLFVVDGSCMASSANQNPSLTYMALTARACYYAVRAMNRMEL